MKNAAQFWGIIALVAIIGFGVAACDNDPEPAHVHTWDNWIETTVPTCTTAGIKTRTCTACGAADTQTQEGTAALGHDWNIVKEVISAVSETENGIKAITCKRDKSHTKDEEVNEYATGTAGLEYTLITTGDYANTYGVRRGTFDGAVVHIPAYHREPTDVDYIPVTTISRFAINPATPNNTLITVTIAAENQLKTIGTNAFLFCPNLTSITIPATVTSIGSGAFNRCTSLDSIIIPTSVTEIGNSAFAGCTNLTSITIPANVTAIGDNLFWGCTSLTNITVDANNPDYTSEGGILYNKDKTNLIGYPSATGSFTIPAGVMSIGERAFRDCASLASITIPEGVTTIDYDAFSHCTSLTSITISSSVTSIGGQAFWNCTSLTSITIPASVTSISSSAFIDWTVTQTINVPFANADATPAGWGTGWDLVNAVIKYWNGTTWE